MLYSCDSGEEQKVGRYVFKSHNIKNINWAKFRMSYKNNIFTIQINNKFNANNEFHEDYIKLVDDIKFYLQDKIRFKFIDDLKFTHIKDDKYSYSFNLDIDNLDLASI